MAPSNEQAYIAKGAMNYMGEMAKQTSSRFDKKVAESSEFKHFLFYLAERAPLVMHGLLKLVSNKCEITLRVESKARLARKRAELHNGDGTNAKRLKLTRPNEQDTASSRRVAKPDVSVQGSAGALLIKQESEQESFDWANVTSGTIHVSDSDEEDDAKTKIVPIPKSSHRVPDPFAEPVNTSSPSRIFSIGKHTGVPQKLTKAEMNIGDETRTVSSSIRGKSRTPRSDSQCSERGLPHTQASQNNEQSATEDSDKEEDDDAEPAKNEFSSVATSSVHGVQEREVPLLPTPYQIEVGLPMRTPVIEAYVKAHCLKLKPLTTRPSFSVHDEIADILDKSRLLEFCNARRELYQYLENRAMMPGKKLQARTTWNMSNPGEILETLQTVKTNTSDAKIHRAYGQTMLFSSVNNQVEEGYKSTVTGHLFDHTAILEELALKKAGSVSTSEKKRMISSYLYEYHAGKRWSAVIDWFGGSGIVLVFVTAGIGSSYVEAGWSNFQRDCLQYIAELLHSTRGMVENLGSDALEVYCRHGCLDSDCIENVKESEFSQPDGDDVQPASDEEPEDESDGEDAQPASYEESEDDSDADDAPPVSDEESGNESD